MKNRFISSITYRERKPFYGFLLSLFFPGLGQMYNGRLQKGTIFLFLKTIPFLILPVLIHLSRSRSYLLTAFSILAISVFVSLFSAADAFIEAKRKSRIEYKPYNQISFYIMFLSVYLLFSSVSGFVFLSVFDFYRVDNPSVILSENDIVLIKKYTPDDYRRGDLVLVKNNEMTATARIVSLPGDSLVIDHDSFILNGKILERGIFSGDELRIMNLENNVISESLDHYKYPIIIKDKNQTNKKKIYPTEKNSILLFKDNRSEELSFIKTNISGIAGRVEGIIWSDRISRIFTPTGVSQK